MQAHERDWIGLYRRGECNDEASAEKNRHSTLHECYLAWKYVTEGAESREGDKKLYVTPEGVEPHEGGEKDEAKTLFCLETGERIPSDAYSRRGHYITCCWGNCSTQSSDEDRSED